MKRNAFYYILLIILFFLVFLVILNFGEKLEAEIPAPIVSRNSTGGSVVLLDRSTIAISNTVDKLTKGLKEPLAILLFQIGLVLVATRIFGKLAVSIGQPSVIGEILAGILLGPSLFGALFPDAYSFVFPKASLGILQLLSQIGLVFFMFIVGMELDLKILRNQADSAILISHASILLPFLLGGMLALSFYGRLAPEGISFLSFSLFMGIGMSITAFPVLARIVQEKGLTKTKLGGLALTCAASDDLTAWCLLACVIALVQAGGLLPGLMTILLALIYILFMWKLVLPWMRRAGNIFTNREAFTKTAVAFFLLFPIGSAWITESIGIHALFGAFLAGVVMPDRPKLRTLLAEKVEDVSTAIFLPLFFALTGIRTQIGLLNEGNLWWDFAWVLAVAILGKFAGSAIAARLSGKTWKDSLSLGALMNTRGLMELIVLNIGYDLGILSSQVFSMMVLMALVTTFMTGPSLNLIERIFASPRKDPKGGGILVAFALHSRGIDLLRLANGLFPAGNKAKEVTALHMSPDSSISRKVAQRYEKTSFEPLHKLSKELGLKLKTLYKPSDNVTKDILKTIQSGNYNIFLTGGARSLFSDDVLGGKIRTLLSESNGNAGILVAEKLGNLDRITVAMYSEADSKLLTFACRLAKNLGSKVSVWDPRGAVQRLTQKDRNLIKKEMIPILRESDPVVLGEADLILCNLETWEEEPELRNWELSEGSGLFLIRFSKEIEFL
ncbi:transporter, CPA2 family [Leptospira broomii serovar Hurstbridge str. 5399]|uniref:Transporter, CPA2 family n=1 Tax=Leptospira broomii serovar Hurstbridge str. 5399 TaxID=1049789 RepID=T0GEN2_9LEPT|nr:cation:proton antiporter [Leptospira broomii]EQA43863.1 transporter, CPA2 family [Leptospira broomii serovar Hurstbridge str. 5399]